MKLDRLLGIVTVLLQNESVTAPYLASRFEVSRRTINRDIEALCQAGIPVVTRQGGRGGISIAEGFKLDKSVLTTEELAAITAALKGIGSVSGKPGTLTMLDKLGGDAAISLRESVVIDLASHYKGSLTEKIGLIKHAVRECRPVTFDYYYEKGVSRRCIEPYFVVFQWTSWYVFGFCRDRQDWRMFKLPRLWNLALCEETYTIRDIPPERLDFDAHLHDSHRLVALFDVSARFRLVEEYGPGCFTGQPDGRLRLEVGYTNHAFTLRWLLSFGSAVQVLEPEAMAREIQETAQQILEGYKREGEQNT